MGVGRCHEVRVVNCFLPEAELKNEIILLAASFHVQAVSCLELCEFLLARFQKAFRAIAAEQYVRKFAVHLCASSPQVPKIESEEAACKIADPEQVAKPDESGS